MLTDERIEAAREKARDAVVKCAYSIRADDEIDGWQGNVNINLALDLYRDLERAARRRC